MALTQQDYFKRPDETIDQYNSRITSLSSSQSSASTPATSSSQFNVPSDPAALQQIVNQAAKTVQNLTAQVQQVTNPVAANTIKPTTTPTLPTPAAPGIVNSFVGGLQQNVDTSRKALEDSIKSQRDQLATQQKQLEDQINNINTKEQGTIENNVQPLLQPFRQQLEDSQRQKFQVEQNYFDNQNTINEINSLATGLQQDILSAQSTAAPASIQEGR